METFNNEEEGFELWLCEILASHESLRENAAMADFLKRFLDRTNEFHKQHGNQILYCRGQQRVLLTLDEAAQRVKQQKQKQAVFFARWYDFVHIGPRARHSGPPFMEGGRRFETITLKIQASRNRSKFGMTDDTGYLFPCLQQNLPRAFFIVMDHVSGNVFIIHGNKKFGGQGDEGVEEGTDTNNNTAKKNDTDIHAPPVKCFPGTENLKPSHYIFTWKANGKNAGVFGYTDPVSEEIWLFVNSKGVCECAGRLQDVLNNNNNPNPTTWFSDLTREDTGQLPPHIFQCFAEIWADGVNQELVISLWKRGFLFLFEYNDNKHVVLEYGKGGRPVDHLAFIGLVQLPTLGTVDTVHSGLVFRVDNEFTFDLWRGSAQGPLQTCKPNVKVKPEHLELATQELMKGRFFPKETKATGEWFNPSPDAEGNINKKQFLAGEGAVVYEMAVDESGDSVIRQLFKAKTASYITHRQFRGFLQRGGKDKESQFTDFGALHRRVLLFCRQKFGDLAEKPYPDPKDFCRGQAPNDVVAAAALFYAHFAMWLQERAINLDSTVSALVGMLNTDIIVPKSSVEGKDYLNTANLLGLLEEDILDKQSFSPGDDDDDGVDRHEEKNQPMLTIKCGMAFRVAEFVAIYGLDHSKVFAAPKDMIKDLEDQHFVWGNVPRGHKGTIKIGFNHAFPDGATPKQPKKKDKKKEKTPKKDIFGPFRKAFSSFLSSNPEVTLGLGRRDAQPDMIIFEPSDSAEDVLVSNSTVEGFNAALLALPSLVKMEEEQTDHLVEAHSQRLTQELAVHQAEETLRQTFPSLRDLFESPVDLQFGDVSGRLVPVLRNPDSRLKMLIIRGVSGIGKSTVAKACQQVWGVDEIPVVEADGYFGPTCPFHIDLLSAAHEDCQNRAREALEDINVRCLVVSNTGLTAWEYAEYLELAITNQASASILTLDTETSLGSLQNLHSVPQMKVEKMSRDLRNPENNPEGKTVEDILEIARKQKSKNGFASHAPALAWTLLGTEGVGSVREIYVAFLQFAKDNGIAVPPRTVRPPNPHATLVFARPSSDIKVLKQMAAMWEHHGTTQEMALGEVKYSYRTIGGSQLRVLVNLAVAVKSFSPNLVDRDTPHITIAYDPDHASAADSNKLWQDDYQWPDDVSVASWDFEPSRTLLSGIVETGVLKDDGVVHQMPHWLGKPQPN